MHNQLFFSLKSTPCLQELSPISLTKEWMIYADDVMNALHVDVEQVEQLPILNIHPSKHKAFEWRFFTEKRQIGLNDCLDQSYDVWSNINSISCSQLQFLPAISSHLLFDVRKKQGKKNIKLGFILSCHLRPFSNLYIDIMQRKKAYQ